MSFRNAIIVVVMLEAFALALGILNYGWTLEGLQATTRYSGRVSLLIFSLIFLFHQHQAVNIRRILSEKYFLVFTIAHGIHLVELSSFVVLSEAPVRVFRVAGGALAYILIFAMPWAESRFILGRISEKLFNQLALVFLYYVWFVFFMTYLPRVRGTIPDAGGSYPEFVALLGWVSLMLGMKITQLLARKTVGTRR